MYINTKTKQTFKTHSDIRIDQIDLVLPAELSETLLQELGYLPVTLSEPVFNKVTQYSNELQPKLINKVWTQQWEILPLSPEEVLKNKTNIALSGKTLLTQTSQPVFNPISQKIVEGSPILTDDSVYLQVWNIVELSPEEVSINIKNKEDLRVSSLWNAAHNYEYSYISGSAVGLLAIGIIQSKPKCIAVQNWIKSIWSEYYTRKAGTSTDTNFDICGVCPYSVPELMLELGI